jgi:hypothetical protein
LHARSLTRMSLNDKRRDVTTYYRSRGGRVMPNHITLLRLITGVFACLLLGIGADEGSSGPESCGYVQLFSTEPTGNLHASARCKVGAGIYSLTSPMSR